MHHKWNFKKRYTQKFTPREQEVFKWLVEGKTQKETGMILGITPRTVQWHLYSIYGKLKVNNLVSAILEEYTLTPKGEKHARPDSHARVSTVRKRSR
jgi:DNA-binding CsgD family transcriptional regulator